MLIVVLRYLDMNCNIYGMHVKTKPTVQVTKAQVVELSKWAFILDHTDSIPSIGSIVYIYPKSPGV